MQGLQEICPTCKKQVLVVDEVRTVAPLDPYVNKVFACGHEYEFTKDFNLRLRIFQTVKKISIELGPWFVVLGGLLGIITYLKQLFGF